LWERVGVRADRKFTTLTFILSLLKEGEEALGRGEAGRESEENCRIGVYFVRERKLARVGTIRAKRATVTARRAMALSAKDQCTPISAPNIPTDTPLKDRSPKLDMWKRPISLPRRFAGAST